MWVNFQIVSERKWQRDHHCQRQRLDYLPRGCQPQHRSCRSRRMSPPAVSWSRPIRLQGVWRRAPRRRRRGGCDRGRGRARGSDGWRGRWRRGRGLWGGRSWQWRSCCPCWSGSSCSVNWDYSNPPCGGWGMAREEEEEEKGMLMAQQSHTLHSCTARGAQRRERERERSAASDIYDVVKGHSFVIT